MDLPISYDYSHQAFQRQCESIKEELSQHFLRSGNECILLIDAALLRQRTEEQALISEIETRQVLRIPLASQYLTDEFFPWLVVLDLSSDKDRYLLDKSIEWSLSEIEPQKIQSGCGRMYCGWLSIHGALEAACVHLGKTALQRKNNKDILLRYYDPAVATLLWKILDSWQRQRLLGPVTSWYSIDGDGQLIQRTGLVQQYAQLSFSLSLSPESWLDIEMIVITNLILREYRKTHSDKHRLNEIQVFQTVLPALRRARYHMFKTKEDLVAYGLHALNVSPDFDCHPEISRLLTMQRAQPDRRYRDAISSVSPKMWAHIQAGDDSHPL